MAREQFSNSNTYVGAARDLTRVRFSSGFDLLP
jgi:hypothetical protein